MKALSGILAFLVFFLPLTGIGLLVGYGLWEGGKNPDGYPMAAVVVSLSCACAGVFVGAHSARATMRKYEHKHDSRPVA
jgi:hypothetical protein